MAGLVPFSVTANLEANIVPVQALVFDLFPVRMDDLLHFSAELIPVHPQWVTLLP